MSTTGMNLQFHIDQRARAIAQTIVNGAIQNARDHVNRVCRKAIPGTGENITPVPASRFDAASSAAFDFIYPKIKRDMEKALVEVADPTPIKPKGDQEND